MTRVAVVLTAAVLLLAGCAKAGTPEKPSPAPTSAPSPSAAPKSSADLTIDYGRVGPAKAGMTHAEAMATGVFRDNLPPSEPCPAPAIDWKKAFEGVDVIESGGRLVSMGVRSPTVKTTTGVRVGSTLGEIKAAYPDLIGPQTSGVGYNQSGVWAKSGDRWIGFLFGKGDDQPVTDASDTIFIEVTKGVKPDLIRDGC